MSASVALKCVNCSAPLRSEDWDRSAGIIKCSHCGVLSTAPASSGAEVFRPRAQVPLPPKVTCEETPLGLTIQRRWFSPVVFFLIPFCVFWNGFLVVWYTIAFTQKGPMIMKLFPLVHVAVGVGLLYFVLAMLLNRTTITTTSGRLSVRHGPLPWAGNAEIDSSDIAQLFCKERIHNTKNGRQYRYEVWCAKHDATTKKVVAAGLDMDQAIYVEQRLEKALGIQDRAVPGELAR